MIQNTISIAGGVTRNPLIRLAQPVTVALSAGEHIAVVGPNGGGKSLLVDTLLGKYPLKEGSLVYDFSPSVTNTVYDNVKYIAFRDTYGQRMPIITISSVGMRTIRRMHPRFVRCWER